MREFKTIEVDRYEPADDHIHLKHVGMKTGYEVFDLLQAHLESVDLVPDEYFSLSPYFETDKELPNYNEAICHTNWGGSEGIYIDIILKYRENGKAKETPFVIGKTLGESGDDFIRMSRIAAECSMMMNGRGEIVRVSEQSYPKEQEPLRSQTTNTNPSHTNDNTLDIYQLKSGDSEIEKLWFRNYDFLKQHNYAIDVRNYDLVYSGPMLPDETLDDIYYRFNCDHPEDYKGHSLSVSDVIQVNKGDVSKVYFTDSFGFKEIPDFFKDQQRPQSLEDQIRTANAKSGSSIQTKHLDLQR